MGKARCTSEAKRGARRPTIRSRRAARLWWSPATGCISKSPKRARRTPADRAEFQFTCRVDPALSKGGKGDARVYHVRFVHWHLGGGGRRGGAVHRRPHRARVSAFGGAAPRARHRPQGARAGP